MNVALVNPNARWIAECPCVKISLVKFICQLQRTDGGWVAEHSGKDIGPVRVTTPTREEALRKLEEEIRYWLEMCPCTGQAFRNVEIEIQLRQ